MKLNRFLNKDHRRFIVKPNVEKRTELDAKWERLNTTLKSTSAGFTPPDVPFKTSELISNYNGLYRKIYDKEKFIND